MAPFLTLYRSFFASVSVYPSTSIFLLFYLLFLFWISFFFLSFPLVDGFSLLVPSLMLFFLTLSLSTWDLLGPSSPWHNLPLKPNIINTNTII